MKKLLVVNMHARAQTGAQFLFATQLAVIVALAP